MPVRSPVLCPSCQVPIEGMRCRTCGARCRAGHWRFGRKTACSVCGHIERPTIEHALVQGQPLRAIAAQFGLSRSALSRHLCRHLKPQSNQDTDVGQRQTKPVPWIAKWAIGLVVFALLPSLLAALNLRSAEGN
jgi:hypothetical protein